MCLLLISVSFFLRETPVTAEDTLEPAIVINEVMWAGTEYIELFNNTDDEIALQGWSIVRERLVSDESKKVVIELEESDKIAPQGYFLLERKTLSDETPPLFEEGLGRVIRGSALMLVNGGERLELRDPNQELVDEVNRLDDWFFGVNATGISRSMERIDPSRSGTNICSWQTYLSDVEVKGRLGTPGTENSDFINPLDAVIDIAKMQIVVGEDVELDAGSSIGFDHGGLTYRWDLGDGHNVSDKIAIHKYPAAGQYEVTLTVFACGFEDEEKLTIEVLELDEDLEEEPIVTPLPIVYKKVHLKDVRKESLGQLLRVEGIVNVLPGTFGERTINLTDASKPIGLQIYFYQADWPALKLGEKIRIDGELSTVLGESRLKVASADSLSSLGQGPLPVPHLISTGKVDEAVEGALVTVSGIVTRSSGNTFYIDDGSGELRIVVKTTTNIQKPSTKKGNKIKITGIVSRTTLGYRLMPRVQADLELIESEIEVEEEIEEEAAEQEGEVASEQIKEVVLKDIREEDIGTHLITEGTISVPPGVLGDRIAYLAGSGIQLYFYKANWPELSIGDRVRVTGELALSLGESRLKITDALDINKIGQTDAPHPKEVSTGSIGEALEGFLVKISGAITQTSGSTFFIDDGSGEVRIVIQESTQIKKPRTSKGTAASIIGVVSQTKSGYRVLPRFQEDIAFDGEVAGLKSFPAAGFLRLYQETSSKSNIIYFFSGAVVMLLLSSAYHSGEPLLGVRKKSVEVKS